MYCRQLELTDFRNFAAVALALGPGSVLILGANAQGKSNLLEAILALSTGRGRASRPLAELIRMDHGEPRPFARVRSDVVSSSGTTRLELVFSAAVGREDSNQAGDRHTSRRGSVDGKPSPVTQFVGRLKAVHFSPEDIELLIGAPSLRRRFLDACIAQGDAGYLRKLVNYNHVLSQRNALLRDLKGRRAPAKGALDFWDSKLAELAAPIVEARKSFIGSLERLGGEAYSDLRGKSQKLGVSYSVERPGDAREIDFIAALELARPRELLLGQTLLGPHRDDVRVTLDDQPSAGFASRGEQRLIVLSLKLAQLGWLNEVAGESPVLLLDDIFSELDPVRRRAVMERIPEAAQVIVSASDESQVPAGLLASPRVLRVEGGAVAWEQVHA